MSFRNTRPRPARCRRYAGLALIAPLVLTLLATVGSSPSAAYDKGLSLGDEVSFDDGSPAAAVQIDLYEALDPYTRGNWLGSTTTNRDGNYSFDVDTGCYMTVAIAPLDAEFDFLGSGRAYDQTYGCVEGGPNNDFDSVLYREDTKPDPPTTTTQTPVTHPPTTAPPTTQPPTTKPPTTVPPPPPPPPPAVVKKCFISHERGGTGWVFAALEIDGSLSDGAFVVRHRADGTEIDRYPYVGGYFPSDWYQIEGWPARVVVDRSLFQKVYDDPGSYPEHLDTNYSVYAGGPYHTRFNRTGDAEWRQVSIEFPGHKVSTKPVTCKYRAISPIALDLDDSNAVERVSGEFSFDFDADGEAEMVSEWFAPTEGILVDTRVEGELSGAHLFGDQGGLYADGYEKLARLDANADGWVAGAELDGLAVWIDVNSNAELDAGEFSTLASHEVEALSVSHENFVSEARLVDGSTMMTEDLWFPAATAASGADTVRVAVLGGAGVALLGYATSAARRRRRALDDELHELLVAQSHTNT